MLQQLFLDTETTVAQNRDRGPEMRKTLDRLYLVSCWFGAFCIGLIGLLVVCQVLLNLIDRISTLATGSAIGLTIPSYADFTGFLLAAASFMALAHTLRDGAHIRVVLLIGRFPKKVQPAVELWCSGFALVVAAYFTWYTALLVVESFTYQDLSPGMIAVPLWIPQSFMLFGLAVLCISLIDDVFSILRGRSPSYLEVTERPAGDDAQSQNLPMAE